MSLVVIILAAGQGSRMKSALPKVLHTLAGRSLLAHVINAAQNVHADKTCIVYGHGGDIVKKAFANNTKLIWVEQAQQLGTGHAVQQAASYFNEDDTVLILYGDVPLIKQSTLEVLIKTASKKALGLLTVHLQNPKGYGRIVRDKLQRVLAIVEEKDANAKQRSINEINTGIMALNGGNLKDWLGRLRNDNAQAEYYLTDIIAMANNDEVEVKAIIADDQNEVAGVNDRRQLAELERVKQKQLAEEYMLQGVTVRDPNRLDIRGEVSFGQDVVIDIDVILEGQTILEEGVTIGPFCHIINSVIGKNCNIKSHTLIENATLKENCTVGPYARLRPGTQLETDVKIGNFVEIKKSIVGEGSKVNHLSYVGDAELGKNVNIGAGTITCNYDGANKYRTIIEDDVFIGSNTALVAPVKIGKGSTIGAGSTIRRDAPENALALTLGEPHVKENWQRPKKRD